MIQLHFIANIENYKQEIDTFIYSGEHEDCGNNLFKILHTRSLESVCPAFGFITEKKKHN